MHSPIPAYAHNAAKTLASIFRVPVAEDLEATLARASASPLCLAPFDLTQVRFVDEQLAVVPQVLWPRPRTSKLYGYLSEFEDQVCLVVDAVKTGRDALYFCRMAADREVAIKWILRMAAPGLMLNQCGPDLIIAAPVKAFAA